MDFQAKLLDGIQFVAAGKLSGKSDFVNEDGEQMYFLKVDFVGGSNNIQVDAEQYAKAPVLGVKLRIQGSVSQNNKTGYLTIKTDKWVTETEPNFKPFTLDELEQGVQIMGVGWLFERSHYADKKGILRNSLKVKTLGALLTNGDLPLEDYNALPPVESKVQFLGSLTSSFSGKFEKGAFVGKQNVLQLNLRKVVAIEEHKQKAA